jgi:hypothetical protein
MSNVTDTARQQNLTDLFTTAIEGGINYWGSVSEYHWDRAWGERYAVVHDLEGDDLPEGGKRLTPEMMGTGLAKLATASPQRRTACGTTFAALSRRLGSDDFPDFDATDADTIAQWALGLTSVWADGRRVELFG